MFAHSAKIGEYLHARLQEFKDHPLVGEVRGKGLLAAIELVANKKTGKAFNSGAVGAFAVHSCQGYGLIVRAVAGSSLALCPPLIIDEQQVDEIIEKMRLALDETLVFVMKEQLLEAH